MKGDDILKKIVVCLLVLLALVLSVGCEADESAIRCEEHIFFGDWQITREATCFEAGEAKRRCENCDAFETKTLDALSHVWGDWVVKTSPSCEVAGVESRLCELCGSNEERPIVSIGHVFGEWTVAREASCSEMGQRVMACEYCDHVLTEEIPMIDHVFGEWSIEKDSTCEEVGINARKCLHCEAKETEEIAVREHDTKGIRCNNCQKYWKEPISFGEKYNHGRGCHITIYSCAVEERDKEKLYRITFSSNIPSVDAHSIQWETFRPGVNVDTAEKTSFLIVRNELVLIASDGTLYTGKMKNPICEISVPDDVEIISIEYIEMSSFYSSDSSEYWDSPKDLIEKSIDGKAYWLIPEE
jgi:hypothetical protein